MHLWETVDLGWFGAVWGEVLPFFVGQAVVVFESPQGFADLGLNPVSWILSKLVVGVVLQQCIHLCHIFITVHHNGCVPFVCRKDGDLGVLFQISDCLAHARQDYILVHEKLTE